MTELQQDRAELLAQRRPATRSDCKARLEKVRHARRKFGAECQIPVGVEDLLEGWLREFEPDVVVEPPVVVVAAPPPIVWLSADELERVNPPGTLRIVGYDSEMDPADLPGFVREAL
jgi:hypothetical protein